MRLSITRGEPREIRLSDAAPGQRMVDRYGQAWVRPAHHNPRTGLRWSAGVIERLEQMYGPFREDDRAQARA
jgi:hypothetical protein